MDRFAYRDGTLVCEDVEVADLARRFGTPLYVYSAETFLGHYGRLAEAFAPLEPMICYSVKVNSNVHLLRMLAEEGCGFDLVSGGELYRVLEAGGEPRRCCFAGVAKTDTEIVFALEQGIRLFAVESEAELANLTRLAAETGYKGRAALRVNPDVDPKTHRYITTGKKETKFGVDLERAERVFRDFHASSGPKHITLDAIHCHIGSQITTVEPYVQAVEKVLGLVRTLREAGITVRAFDLGGGFGVNYEGDAAPTADAYAAALVPMLQGAELELYMEPGRFIAGNAGVLVTEVQYVKAGGDRRFLMCDAGMHHLIRPALYGAYHFIWPVTPAEGLVPAVRGPEADCPGTEPVDVVGPICESGDFLGKDRRLPPVERGDLLAVFTAGAYGMVMASEYNSHPRPAEVLVEGSDARLIRRRGTYGDLVQAELEV